MIEILLPYVTAFSPPLELDLCGLDSQLWEL